MKAKSTPEGYHSLTPFITVDGVAEALEFYKTVFNATEVLKREMNGKVLFAQIMIGDSRLMISDKQNEMGRSAGDVHGSGSSGLRVYIDDVDAIFLRALDAGAVQESPVEDRFYGDRVGSLIDPFGNRWRLSQHLEELPSEEIERRMRARAS